MKPLGAPFFFAVCKLLIAIICLVTWIVHNEKSEPLKISTLINTLLVAKYIQYLGMCSLGTCSFFCTGNSTAICLLQLLIITVAAEDTVMVVNNG